MGRTLVHAVAWFRVRSRFSVNLPQTYTTGGLSMSDLKKKFDAAAKDVLKAKTDPSNELKLRLYAHYKQATEGDVKGDKPGFTDFVGRAKYDAWAKLKGTPTEKAMEGYVKLVERVTRE
jgi:diazepam-binding inhibitor (GABA receptor modulating acyl-CoA-binding protein)